MPESTYKLLWLAVSLSFDELELTVSQTGCGAEISGFWVLVCGRDTNLRLKRHAQTNTATVQRLTRSGFT